MGQLRAGCSFALVSSVNDFSYKCHPERSDPERREREGESKDLLSLLLLTQETRKRRIRPRHGIIIGMFLARGLPIFALLTIAVAAQTQSPDSAPPMPVAESAAQLIGILPEVTELRKLSAGAAPADRWQVLWLHQRITEQVMTASLQVDATLARIDNEVVRANELRGYLADRRALTVNRANLLGIIVGGGLGAAGSSMQFSSSGLAKTGDALSLGGGLASVGLGLIGLRAQPGKTSHFDFDSNMLAEFFDRPVLPDSRYPPAIWTFLNQLAATGPSGLTRKQQLLQTWVEVKRIDSLASADKIDRVTSQPSELLKLTIDDLEDRAAMLLDVRARISFLKRDLAAVLASLPDAPPSLTQK